MNKIYGFITASILFLFSIVPVFWFVGRGNILIDGVDTNFPLNPVVWFMRRFFAWNSVTNAGSDFSASIAGLFFHAVQVIPYSIGVNLQYTQIISFVFWFSAIVISSYILARQLTPKRVLIQLLFVSLYSFNIFLFNTWENVKVSNLSLMAGIPLALSILFLQKNNKISKMIAAFYSIILGIIVSGTGINPAYFISFFLVLILYVISEFLVYKTKESISTLKNFLLLALIILLVNAFWIIPTGNYILQTIPAGGSIDKIGYNNWIDSLSDKTSLLNIMRMQGAWDWYTYDSMTGLPLYIPYALNYFHNWIFITFSFLITAVAILGLLFHEKEKRSLALYFGCLLVLGAFLGAGTHLPTGDLYKWLLIHLPFFSLFRSPWYIFTPLLILSFAGLSSLFFSRLFDLYESKKQTQGFRFNFATKSILSLGITSIIIGNLFYSYPLITGKIFRPDQQNNFLVKFPDYIYKAGEWLSADKNGRIIGYPDNEIEEFSWGYRGIESILSLIVDRDVLFSPLNAPDSPVAFLIREFYENLKKGQIESANSIAAKLNISLIHEKNDQKSITLPLPDGIKLFNKTSFGPWNFYKLSEHEFLPKIYSTGNIYKADLTYADKNFINALKSKDLLVNSRDKIITQIPKINNISNEVILSNNSQSQEFKNFQLAPSKLATRLISRDLSTCTFTFEILEDSLYQPIIERYRLQDFGIDLSKGIELEIDNKKTLWRIDSITNSYLFLEQIFLTKGKHEIVLKLVNDNLTYGGNFESGEYFKRGGEGRGEGVYEIEDSGQNKFLSISNIDKADISADFKVVPFNPLGSYYIEVKYKQIYGNNTNILVTQSKNGTLFKAQIERMPNHPEWKLASFYYDPVKVDSNMSVELLAPHISDPLGTKILYDDLKVQKVFTNQLLFLNKAKNISKELLAEPKVEFQKISPIKYQANITGADKPHVIVFSENYSPNWEIEVFEDNGSRINAEKLHFTANLYANAWYLEGTPTTYKIVISYTPQKYFWIGITISSLTIITIIVIFFLNKEAKRNF